MQGQQARHREQALPNPLDRPGYVLGTSFIGATVSGALGLPLEPILAAIGAASLLIKGWRGWRRTGRLASGGLVLLTALAYFGGVSASLLVAFEQYLIPTVMLGTLLSGFGAAIIVRWLRAGRPRRAGAYSEPARPGQRATESSQSQQIPAPAGWRSSRYSE